MSIKRSIENSWNKYLNEVGIIKQSYTARKIMKNKKIKCDIYTRVSTTMQVDGYSLDAQKEKLKR